ncbi:hypothetical protein FLJC2902T_11290 [Flavobacterium limnosediminis JC2902]|uniref:Lipoprotein n=1 Tax=Flavobacterium limnosediminis JC2902 TaxID=1341181 RepID=V6SR22_9FLAO|nr:hypothetical protein [Flavobacterium limnosediminis]ESU29091.1 hypothetical protein FLJC2902T_11290 [Flavobacterium limnosediminis JC2902]
MKIKSSLLLLLSLLLFSCNNKQERIADSDKAAKHNDSVFAVISQNWKFNIPPVSPKVQPHINRWQEWRTFNQELQQKPKSSLNAFRLKAKTLTVKGDLLNNNAPALFDKPAVKSRISTLNTKLKSLETYITLEYIPTKKVTTLIQEITTEVTSIQNQMNEIIVKSEIPKEEGEAIMLQALDTARHARREIQEPKQ